MESIYKSILPFITNPIVSFSFLLAGFVLTVICFFLAIKLIRRKNFSIVDWENNNIVNTKIMSQSDINIKHKKKKIKGLNLLELRLKNVGNQVVKISDLHRKPEISFSTKVKILDVEIQKDKDYLEVNTIINDSSSVTIDFNFLEPKDTIYIKILYDCESAVGGYVKGKIIGGNKINFHFTTSVERELDKNISASGFALFILLFVVFVNLLSFISKIVVKYLGIDFADVKSYVHGFIFLIAFILCLILMWGQGSQVKKKALKDLIDKGKLSSADKKE